MVKKKRTVEASPIEGPMAIEEAVPADSLHLSLEEIKSYPGVLGYILRNSTSATIDLKDSSKISDYAILSSSALQAGTEFSGLFGLGDVHNMIVDGKNTKMFLLVAGENTISIFLERNVDAETVARKFRTL